MFCTACGTRNLTGSNFCKQCGHKLEKTTPIKISEEDYDRALPEDEQVSALLERAYRLRTEGDPATAIALCEEALRLLPESASAHSLLAQLYEQSGQRERAIAELECVLRHNPGSIADRVKLDELRDGGVTVPRKIVAPRVTRPSPPVASGFNGLGRLAFAGALLVILAMSATYALVNRANSEPDHRTRFSTLSPPNSALTANNTAQGGDRSSETPANGTNTARTSALNTVPNNGYYPPPYYPYYPQPIYLPASSGTPRATQAPGKLSPVTKATDGATGKSGRIVLPGEGGDNGDSEFTVHVSSDKSDPNAVKGSPKTGGGPKASDGNGSISIKVHPEKGTASSAGGGGNTGASGGNGTTSSQTANSESRSLMTMGEKQMLSTNYSGAITAFRKALDGAHDDTGYIYQQIAICYYGKGDKSSAMTNYRRAIEEYQKLRDAGRLTDRDRDSIRICENGIKLCGPD